MSVRIWQYEPSEIIEGLVDGGMSSIKCSSCKAPLVDIWITRADQPITWKVKAGCPFCGDGKPSKLHGSYWVTFEGGIHYGATDKTFPDAIEMLTDDENKFTGEVLITTKKL